MSRQTDDPVGQSEHEDSLALLRLINESGSKADLVRSAARLFRERSGCGATGIRLAEGPDFPYFEASGFPAEFLLRENTLCARDERGCPVLDAAGNPVLECMCGSVLSGRVDPSRPFFTPGGSFWINSTTDLPASAGEAGRLARTRNRCHREGFESVALIPLRHQGRMLGLVQLNDPRPNRFSPGAIRLWERLADLLAVAVAKFQAEEGVRASADRYRSLFNEMTEGFALHRIVCDEEGRPSDYRFLDVNPAFERLTGLPRDRVEGRLQSEVLPGESPALVRLYGEVAISGHAIRFEHFSPVLRSTFEVFAYCPEPGQFATLFMNVSDRKRHEMVLRHTVEELARLNENLEQFVNVVSHDLKEPLRMVASFLGLLRERAGSRLEGAEREWVALAGDAAGRMQRLIDDLLVYARLGRDDRRETVPVDRLVDEALDNLRMSVEETGAAVRRGPLPSVVANRTELGLVFQNLIGNALKFRNGRTPDIRITAAREGAAWRFSVADNGIGIPTESRERIFMIFERLHAAEAYPGTGMGLAICRKIVERHGGRIWVESEPGRGSAFHFTVLEGEGEEGHGRTDG